jgi:crossover junction endodeoxyribonuclease RuvC
MKLNAYLGIDPGQSGGLALVVWHTLSKGPKVRRISKMPATETDIHQLFVDWCCTVAYPFKPLATIEAVHAMPKQGVSSAFTFGRGYGFLRGCLIASQVSFQEVQPRAWQKGLGITPRRKTETKVQFKNRLKGFAQQRFPGVEGINLATADALLIALYACLRMEGKL